MAGTLNDFRKRIDEGGAACRITAWDAALVFAIVDPKCGRSYFVGKPGSSSSEATECLSWNEVLGEIGDWADYEDWRTYRLLQEVR